MRRIAGKMERTRKHFIKKKRDEQSLSAQFRVYTHTYTVIHSQKNIVHYFWALIRQEKSKVLSAVIRIYTPNKITKTICFFGWQNNGARKISTRFASEIDSGRRCENFFLFIWCRKAPRWWKELSRQRHSCNFYPKEWYLKSRGRCEKIIFFRT